MAGLFLRLGCTAFGGPAAHIALMEEEVVRRRRWLSPERFLDMLGAANLIPGPSSSELAIFIGYERAGWRGLLVAGACFILPASLMTAGIAWAYVRFGTLPSAGGLLYGIKPVVIAIVAQALWGLAPKAVKSVRLGVLGALAVAAVALHANPLAVLVATGAASSLTHRPQQPPNAPDEPAKRHPLLVPLLGTAAASGAAAPGLGLLFLTFVKFGAVVFGSGYVLLAFLRDDLVSRLGWLTEAQLLDAVAVGQVTPGPVFTTATFIGYLIGRGPGAAAATIGIFLPGFVLVAILQPIVARVRRSAVAGAFLDGVNVASLALMAVVGVEIGRAALVDWITAGIAVASAVLLVRFKVSPTWLLPAGALLGLGAHALELRP